MPSHSEMSRAQHTDFENSKPQVVATKPGDDLKLVSRVSTQEYALRRFNQNTVAGTGGDPVTASRK